ncbi:zinc-binding dehydrogenase [Sorangium cellulosum]|uniref:zinc-binding dehydrogenase n=1 Tax=Sorangium cellulosum TaxID=56 RepID=UPI0018F8A35B
MQRREPRSGALPGRRSRRRLHARGRHPERARYDLILDAAAYRSIFDYRRVLRDGGTYLFVGGTTGAFLQVALLGRWSGSRAMKMHATRPNAADLAALTKLFEEGRVRSVIDRRYPLSGVPEAVRYLESRRARGKVVVTCTATAGPVQ